MNDSIDSIKNRFNAHDVFGLLVPGFTLLLCVYIFELSMAIPVPHPPFLRLVAKLAPAANVNAIQEGLFLIVAGLFVYVTGHVVATIASLFLDRILVFKAHGYPYKLLIHNEKDPVGLRNIGRRAFYRGTFFWANLLLAHYYFLSINTHYPTAVIRTVFHPVDHFPLLTTPFCSILSIIISIAVIFKIGASYRYDRKNEGKKLVRYSLWSGSFRRRLRGVWYWVFRIYSGPYDIIYNAMTPYLHTTDSLEAEVQTKYKAQFKSAFGMETSQAASNNYWFPLFYIFDHSPPLAQMMRNWFQRYTFARNMAPSFYLAYLYCIVFVLAHPSAALLKHSQRIILFPLIYFLMSFLMLIRFHYLNVCYYSKILFRAFVYLREVDNPRKYGLAADLGHVAD